QAARLYLETVPEKLRAERGLSLMRRMAAEPPQVAIAVGQLAAEAALATPKSPERYRIHQLLGEIRLAAGEVEGAWENFLTAAFGLPEDPGVNLNLARIYEKQGRLKRAWSRYRFTATLMEKETNMLTPAEREEVRAAMER